MMEVLLMMMVMLGDGDGRVMAWHRMVEEPNVMEDKFASSTAPSSTTMLVAMVVV